MRVYLDSNVFISMINQEMGFFFRPLFREAEDFFSKVKKGKHTLILSDLFFKEVIKHCFNSREDILNEFRKKELLFECFSKHDKLFDDFFIEGIHLTDCIHIRNALASNCDCIVSFNAKHFSKACNKINVFDPIEAAQEFRFP